MYSYKIEEVRGDHGVIEVRVCGRLNKVLVTIHSIANEKKLVIILFIV